MIHRRRTTLALALIALAALAARRAISAPAAPDRESGLAAWGRVYSVLTSPRCLDCHTATGWPEQGDDRHRHLVHVARGPAGAGVPGLKCAACHQSENADSVGVPGAPGWRLAPLSMAWQDKDGKALSSAAVCRVVLDKSKNGGLDGPGLIRHHEEEALVRWAFAPGRRRDGTPRALPPLTHEQFVAATRRWVDAGTPCP